VRTIVNTVAAAVLLLAAGGCVVVTDQRPSAGPSSSRANTDANATVTKALKDVERFWTTAFPTVGDGQKFQPVQGGYHPYTETKPPPACGDSPAEYQPNAFYCPAGDFIAWDAQNLIPQLQTNFGPLLVGVVLAHEYGHAVQTRLGVGDLPTVVLEQQADCYAGAWLTDALAGRSTAFPKVTPRQLDTTVGGILRLRDQPGTSATDPQAHGNAFDRIRAVQDGVEKGVRTCAAYRPSNLPVTEIQFQTPQDQANGGDLPYQQAVRDLGADAQSYWAKTFPKLAGRQWADLRVVPFDPSSPPDCANPDESAGGSAFYCRDGDFAAFDSVRLGPELYQNFGDNAIGMLIGDLFARAAQDRRGASTQDRAGQLAVDCLAGSWTNSLLLRSPGEGLTLSPGDLDEAVAALIAFGRAGDDSGPSAFDRIGAYRDGVLQGAPSCS
jgi:predicted metalloprotease